MSYLGHHLGESYPSAEIQSVYSAAPTDWATRGPRIENQRKRKARQVFGSYQKIKNKLWNNVIASFGLTSKGLEMGSEKFENQRKNRFELNYSIVNIALNIVKSPVDLRLCQWKTISLLYEKLARCIIIIIIILEADTIKQAEMKEKIQKEYFRRTRKLLETKLYSRNFIKGINTWAVPLIRYSGPFLKWTRDELKQMDQSTRKLMTIHKALHPRDDFDRLYVSRKEGGRGLASTEDSFGQISPLAFFRWFLPWPRIGMMSLVTVSPVITAFHSCCLNVVKEETTQKTTKMRTKSSQ